MAKRLLSVQDCQPDDLKPFVIPTKNSGDLNVFVQGNANNVAGHSAVFLTVHDMGSNHADFFPFTEHGSMQKIKEKSAFIHVDLPGQQNNAEALADSFKYPTLQEIAEDLVCVLDHFKVKFVIGLGEGAGANILARFGMAFPDRTLGLILIHCTSTTAGVMEHFNDKIMSWKLSSIGMNPTADQYLVFHKYGTSLMKELENTGSSEGKEKLIQDYINILHEKINANNLRLLVNAFLNRTDISAILKDSLKVNTLLVTGQKASHLHTVDTMYNNMDHTKTEIIKLSDVGDVLHEAPEKLAKSLLLFAQGLGVLSAVHM